MLGRNHYPIKYWGIKSSQNSDLLFVLTRKKYRVIVIYKQMVILNIFSVIVSINVKRVGEALMTHIHILAQQQNIAYLSADVSITAMTFFEKKRI